MNRIILETLPLENGDCLTRGDFERRYQTMPFLKKAELIEGVVYMSSPVRVSHGESHALLITWLGNYWSMTPGISLADNTTVRLDADNEPQPDALLRIQVGGQSRISGDGYIEGAPELMAEVAGSSASLDLRDKLRVYRRNQVQEYLVWRVYEGEIDWFRWREGEYVRLPKDEMGVIKSEVFPGLWLRVPGLISGNLTEVQSTLTLGLNSSEHQRFLADLARRI